MNDDVQARRHYSAERVEKLRSRIEETTKGVDLKGLTIFTVGSYGRLEASAHSDIDLFFMYDEDNSPAERRTSEMRLFGRLIDLVDELGFPKFSNDAQYLQSHLTSDVLKNLGGPEDDALNYFTTRMLLLLESRSLFGEESYDRVIDSVIDSYYRDYPRHENDFNPWFLMNDIMRFWKTLLLNYENKRNRHGDEAAIPPRVKNFKLKFSRAATCFATICAIASAPGAVEKTELREIIKVTPVERFHLISRNIPSLSSNVEKVIDQYTWFLAQTALSKEDLEAKFVDRNDKKLMFRKGREFGDSLYELLTRIDSAGDGRLIRSLVV